MPFYFVRICALICILSIFLFAFVHPAHAQQIGQDPVGSQGDEIIRINTDLVQLDVMVFDKQGKFVKDLQPEQFELRLDGRPQTIAFFDRVTSGSGREEAQLSALRDAKTRSNIQGTSSDEAFRGRAIFFFIDDLHLSSDSIARTRKLLQRYIDNDMGENDQAVIISASGQIGFLQQLTDNKSVLHAAVMQINYRARSSRSLDLERPPISEFEALAIARNDTSAINYFADQTLKENPEMYANRESAEEAVRMRARQILEQTAVTTVSTLTALQNLVRSSAQLAGRKLTFFISDGFFLDTSKPGLAQKLDDLISAAARSGVVIYTMDARGLTTGLPDASSNVASNKPGRLTAINGGEVSASQDLLRTLAADTGGRALLNTNALDKALTNSLSETSAYYLIAWKPDRQTDSTNKFQHIEISIKEHPELSVRSRRGFYAKPTNAPAPKSIKLASKAPASSPQEAELRAAIGSLYPRTALPTHLSLGYVNTANEGTMLTASIQVDAADYEVGTEEGPTASKFDVLCVVFDSKGKPVTSVKSQVSFAPKSAVQGQPSLRRAAFSRQFKMTPGLYQVRLAARDNKSGRTGSSRQWIEIPDIPGSDLALGSLIVAEHAPEIPSAQANAPAPEIMYIRADHLLKRTSQLSFSTFIYNAASPPDITLGVSVLRNGQPVIVVPPKRIETKGPPDFRRIPYAGEVALGDIGPGNYVLQVTIIDQTTKRTATQELKFAVR
jgi:VWFA-related protein